MSHGRYPPSISACRLYQRISANGRPYLAGSLGGMSVTVLATGEVSESGQPIWELKFSERQRPTAGRSNGQPYPPRTHGPARNSTVSVRFSSTWRPQPTPKPLMSLPRKRRQILQHN